MPTEPVPPAESVVGWLAVRREMLAVIERSVTSAESSGRTVTDPAKAAEYATNALLMHNVDLLARAAFEYAEDEVRALLNDGSEHGRP